uniref:Sodium-dependent lysophosphatidylcholine symporter 1 n=1 Tax=Aquila chrysaetos chrysaetos TaxID=223781 RepID=A0A663EER7_AQUCH
MGLGEPSGWDKQWLEVSCQPEVPIISQAGLFPGVSVCYAVGGIPYQMTGNALGFFLQIFLLDVVQPFHVSLIIFLGRAWDAVTDPAVGFLVSKSPRRKYGKLVPWIACSMPFGVLCYCMMWSTLSDATPTSLKFLWYLLMYSFFQTCMTCHHVPYSSLTMFLGGTQRDRDSATAYSKCLCPYNPGLPLWGRHHWLCCQLCVWYPRRHCALSLIFQRRAYVFASLVLGSIYCLSCLILIFGVREEPGKVELPFASCLRMIVGHKPYTHLLCGFLFASLAFQITQGIFAFFCTHAAGLAGKFQHLVLIMLVTASLSIPFWQWFLGRFGKKTAASLGLAVTITQVMHNFLAFVFLVIVAGCSMAVLYLLPWSMLPDTVDDFMLRNPSCLNLEALFYSFYVFFNKFAGGLAVGVSTLSLQGIQFCLSNIYWEQEEQKRVGIPQNWVLTDLGKADPCSPSGRDCSAGEEGPPPAPEQCSHTPACGGVT